MARTQAQAEVSIGEFVRGDYKNLTQPTTVTWHGKPIGIWTPVGYTTTPDNAAYVASTTAQTPSLTRSFVASTTLPAWLAPQEEKDGS